MKAKRWIPMILVFCMIPLWSGCMTWHSGKRLTETLPKCYAEASGFQTRVRAIVNGGDREYTFTLNWTWSPEGSEIRVVSPESIAGICAHFSADTQTLEYAGEILSIPETVSPLELMPLLQVCWTAPSAEYTSAGEKNIELIWQESTGEYPLELRTTFDAERKTPLESTVFVNGAKCVTFVFDTFAFV